MTASSSIIAILFRLLCGPYPAFQSMVHAFDGRPYVKIEVLGSFSTLVTLAVVIWLTRQIRNRRTRAIVLWSANLATCAVFAVLTLFGLTARTDGIVPPLPPPPPPPMVALKPKDERREQPVQARCDPYVAETIAKAVSALDAEETTFEYPAFGNGPDCIIHIKISKRKASAPHSQLARRHVNETQDSEGYWDAHEPGIDGEGQPSQAREASETPMNSVKKPDQCAMAVHVYGEQLSEPNGRDGAHGYIPTYSSANLTTGCRNLRPVPPLGKPLKPDSIDGVGAYDLEH